MASITWDMPDFDQENLDSIKNCLTDLNEKMLNVGCLEINDGENLDKINNEVHFENYGNDNIICELIYKLPNSDKGSIKNDFDYFNFVNEEYTTADGHKFKKIESAYYDDTECYIKMTFSIFYFGRALNVGRYGSFIFRCKLEVADNVNFDNSVITYMNHDITNSGGISGTEYIYANTKDVVTNKRCHIQLNENSLFIYWLGKKKNGFVNSGSTINNRVRFYGYCNQNFTIFTQIYRKKGNIYVISPKYSIDGSSSMVNDKSSMSYYVYTELKTIEKINNNSYVNNITSNWLFNLPAITNNKLNTCPTYLTNSTNIILNNNLYISKLNVSNEQDIIIQYDNFKVLKKFINLGEDVNARFKPMVILTGFNNANNPSLYSYMWSFDDYELTERKI